MPAILSTFLYLALASGNFDLDTLSHNSLLYNGREYAKQYTVDMGNPFYPVQENRGDILYQGNWYRDLMFYYDCEDHVVVIAHPLYGVRIQLVPEKLDAFKLNGHSFLKVDIPGQGQSIHELKYSGKRQLLVRWQKQLVKNMQEQSVYVLSKRLFVVEGSTMTGITQLSDIYGLFPSEKKFLRQVYRDQRLSFRKDPVNAAYVLIKAAETR